MVTYYHKFIAEYPDIVEDGDLVHFKEEFYALNYLDARTNLEEHLTNDQLKFMKLTEIHEDIPDYLICEECRTLLKRCGNNIYCENGCVDDDIRNDYSEDELEAFGINDARYPPNEGEF